MSRVMLAKRDDMILSVSKGDRHDTVVFSILRDHYYSEASKVAFVGKRRFYQIWKYFDINTDREFMDGDPISLLGALVGTIISTIYTAGFVVTIINQGGLTVGQIFGLIVATGLTALCYKIQLQLTVAYIPDANAVRVEFESMIERGSISSKETPAEEYLYLLGIEKESSF